MYHRNQPVECLNWTIQSIIVDIEEFVLKESNLRFEKGNDGIFEKKLFGYFFIRLQRLVKAERKIALFIVVIWTRI